MLAVGLVLMAMLAFVCGLIIDTVARKSRAQYEMDVYLLFELKRKEIIAKQDHF